MRSGVLFSHSLQISANTNKKNTNDLSYETDRIDVDIDQVKYNEGGTRTNKRPLSIPYTVYKAAVLHSSYCHENNED